MMLGMLPQSLTVDGEAYKIRTDFRAALLIFQAFADTELSDQAKAIVCLQTLYCDKIPDNAEEALKQAVWFLDGGDTAKLKPLSSPVIDWEQDAPLYFPAVNSVAGFEVRGCPYLHWWTFLGYFREIRESLFSQVVNIRVKKAKGKKLEKYESEFSQEHPELVRIRPRYTEEEQAEIDALNAMLG